VFGVYAAMHTSLDAISRPLRHPGHHLDRVGRTQPGPGRGSGDLSDRHRAARRARGAVRPWPVDAWGFIRLRGVQGWGRPVLGAEPRGSSTWPRSAAGCRRGVNPTLGPDATAVGWVFEYALVDTTGQHDLSQLRSFQDWTLRYWLQGVDGVAEVASVGRIRPPIPGGSRSRSAARLRRPDRGGDRSDPTLEQRSRWRRRRGGRARARRARTRLHQGHRRPREHPGQGQRRRHTGDTAGPGTGAPRSRATPGPRGAQRPGGSRRWHRHHAAATERTSCHRGCEAPAGRGTGLTAAGECTWSSPTIARN